MCIRDRLSAEIIPLSAEIIPLSAAMHSSMTYTSLPFARIKSSVSSVSSETHSWTRLLYKTVRLLGVRSTYEWWATSTWAYYPHLAMHACRCWAIDSLDFWNTLHSKFTPSILNFCVYRCWINDERQGKTEIIFEQLWSPVSTRLCTTSSIYVRQQFLLWIIFFWPASVELETRSCDTQESICKSTLNFYELHEEIRVCARTILKHDLL